MTSGSLRAALFVTAVLAGCDKLDYHLRAALVRRVYPFDVDTDAEIVKALEEAAQGCGLAASAIPRPSATLLHQARTLADEWQAEGVRVIAPDEMRDAGAVAGDLPAIFFTRGNSDLLAGPVAAVVNSRQARTVGPEDRWVITTRRLVDYAVSEELTVVSSTGTLPYSLVCRAAKGSRLIVICDDILPFMLPTTRRKEFFEKHGDLFDDAHTLFLSPFSPGKLPSRPARMVIRDHLVAGAASVILVADVRPDGNMHAILKNAAKRNLAVLGLVSHDAGVPRIGPVTIPKVAEKRHGAQGRVRAWQPPECLSSGPPSPEPRNVNPLNYLELCKSTGASRIRSGSARARGRLTTLGRSFLIHYTRCCPGPWPGQTLGEYCQTLIDGYPSAAHTAFDTLSRILAERLIRGGSRLIRGQRPVVSFTECLPEDLEPLVAWRSGLLRWSFERYGLAIRKDILVALGARRVIYGYEDVFRSLPDQDKHFFQLTKPGGYDWTAEKEWRLLGDVALSNIPRSYVAAIVPTLEEAARISSIHDVPVAWPRQEP